MRIALRVEVSSLRGLREGVPNLMRLFNQYQVRATFLFPLGGDDAGRRPLPTWRSRSTLGLRALTYGTLRQSPSLADAASMRVARDNGHEVGLFGMSPNAWRDGMAHADENWTRDQCDALWSSCQELGCDDQPLAFATPGWQLNPTLLSELGAARFSYSSLTRGKLPYRPVSQGVRSAIPELPTTLPTVDEVMRQPGVTDANAHEYLYTESRRVLPAGHVYAIRAEREGIALLSLMEKLLIMWKGYEGTVRALGDMLDELDIDTLPVHQVGWGTVDGDDRVMAIQSVQVPR